MDFYEFGKGTGWTLWAKTEKKLPYILILTLTVENSDSFHGVQIATTALDKLDSARCKCSFN